MVSAAASASAAVANALWFASNLSNWAFFKSALSDPQRYQEELLRRYISTNADSAFGREHGFGDIRTCDQYQKRVPIRDYDALKPWIDRLVRGEQGVLTCQRVARLVPTSGSTAAKKLIPYTAELHRELNRAVGPWIVDLFSQHPNAMTGPAYWSLTPLGGGDSIPETSTIPIGFDDDSSYLGGHFKRLIDSVMAVPARLGQVSSIQTLRYITLLLLLRRPDLALISVWHPSFLDLLLAGLSDHWNSLLQDIATGRCTVEHPLPSSLLHLVEAQPDPRRARELSFHTPSDCAAHWPNLAVISCWADGHASASVSSAMSWAKRAGIFVQPKGLLAT